ncbi:IclR family transcriptional regulator [Arthrobacter sp. MI7-26]|uniref:IclR family transcriptional regulator n=1 Tax=Arthrobacter sp. MI7-26 TaxID=2993653 RepID=UPI002248F45E|nr:IclR family transcriptional regulator [Arthrobacter sp. MI7-26]MCX2746816.1 IclR family transcriptional regulator [Arthrobacter sp. MI7-26]
MLETMAKYQVEALARGLRVLRILADTGKPQRLTELVELVQIPTATLFRVVSTLEHEGYLDKDKDGRYFPAVGVLQLGFASLRASGLVGVAEGPLKDLSRRIGETVNLGILTGDRILYLIRIRNSDLVTAHLEAGSSLPATSTSIGKVLLSQLEAGRRQELLSERSFNEGGGPNAVRSFAEFEAQMAGIREQGYAIQDEEVAAGLRSIAAPIVDADGRVVAGVNIAVASSRFTKQALLDDLKDELLRTSSDISRHLGAVVQPKDTVYRGQGRKA